MSYIQKESIIFIYTILMEKDKGFNPKPLALTYE